MELRPYQSEAKERIYKAFREGHKSVLLQLPTGAGKTILFSSIVKHGYEGGRRVLILAHRNELLEQARDKLLFKFGISSGIIKSGKKQNLHEVVQIASVQTMVNRELYKPVDLVIIDEAHHMQSGNTYGKIRDYVLSLNKDCKFLGVTATPCRTNGSGFKGVFDTLIQGISIPELIRQGFLAPPRYFIAPLDLGKIKVSAGDYNLKELSAVYQRKVHAEDLVNNWLKLAKGLKTIGFAVDVEHSKTIVEAYRKQGIPAAHVDGKSSDEVRKTTIKQFQDGKIQVLYNVGVFDEGFDVPAIEAVQLARPTKSLIKYLQMIGRSLRPVDGKNYALVLDHSGLVAEHDLVETERDWTLDGVTKTDSGKEIAFKDDRDGKVYKPDQLPLSIPMEHVQLVEITKELIDQAKRVRLNQDYNGLKAFAEYKGYKSKWVWYRMASRINVKDPLKKKKQLLEIATIYCENNGFKNGHAHHLVDEYLQSQTNS